MESFNLMKNLLIIGTGGTIASKKSKNGLSPQISSDELLKYIPDYSKYANIDNIDLLNLDSTNMQPEHWIILSKYIEENYEKYDGFIICHGTDTMAYTAAALSYMIQSSYKPIAITGAQKPIDMDITDAKTNLLDSIIFCSCDKAYGVNIVFDGKVICGTRARKERTKSYNAFSSINFPYLATIQDGHIVFYIDDKPADFKNPVFYHRLNTKIALLKLIPSMSPDILYDMAKHYDAIIIESFGVGGLPTYDRGDFKKSVEEIVALGKIVVMTTQVPLEGSHMSVYEVGRNIKQKLELIESYDMTLEASVTKLMWILALSSEPSRVRELFYTTINRDTLFKL